MFSPFWLLRNLADQPLVARAAGKGDTVSANAQKAHSQFETLPLPLSCQGAQQINAVPGPGPTFTLLQGARTN